MERGQDEVRVVGVVKRYQLGLPFKFQCDPHVSLGSFKLRMRCIHGDLEV